MICSKCKKEIREGEEKTKVINTHSGIYVVVLCKDCYEKWGEIPF